MYSSIIAIIFVLSILFLIYIFYPKINTLVQKHIISYENINEIKREMKYLNDEIEEIPPQNSKIMENISDILYLPIDFIYKLIITYGTPVFYNLSYKNI
jgi:uncharacterized membrane protein (DUF106 family)